MLKLLLTLFFVPFILLGQVVQSFDTQLDTTWLQTYRSDNATEVTSNIVQTLDTENKIDGEGSMRVEYVVNNIETYGGFVKIEHMKQEAGSYDWSAYDSISFWYNNVSAQTAAGRVHVRFNLSDNSDVADTLTNSNDMEFYYSFHYVLDNEPGWNEIKIPLIDGRGNPAVDEWAGEAFNRTGWAGIPGNDKLDPQNIKGFAWEFSIDCGANCGSGDSSKGVILLDNLSLKGFKGKDVIFFNGKSWPASNEVFTWGQSTLTVADDMGATEGTNAMQWVQGDEWGNGWTGAGFNIPAIDLKQEWAFDSLRFKMKADVGTDTMRLQFEDGTNKVGYFFDPVPDDGEWHDYNIALKDFEFVDGSVTFDTTSVTVFQFMAEGNGTAGTTIYFDDMWTGDPEIDVVAPLAPSGVLASADEYFNQIVWQDVDGEVGETYSVYVSNNPITDLNADGVELIQSGIAEEIKTAIHHLFYPLKDKAVTLYYAVTCTDAFSNTSEVASGDAVVNTAKAMPTISLTIPGNLVLDGDISEWEDAGIMPFTMSPETHYTVNPQGGVTDSDDLSATVYLAVDDDYLYIAADVIDDVFHFGEGDWWNQDALEYFIGLYDSRNGKHSSYQRENEPDYKIVVTEQSIFREPEQSDLYLPEDTDFWYFEAFDPDYAFEAKISLDSIGIGNDYRFYPKNGMRIPFELYFHDNDGSGHEGNLAYSPLNTDNAHQNPQQWGYTWIGDTNQVATAIEDDQDLVANTYQLGQNYPNPFNPETTIEFSLAKTSDVKISVFNVVGQELEVLVNSKMQAGTYKTIFNGAKYASGIYFYKIQAGNFTDVRKMLIVK